MGAPVVWFEIAGRDLDGMQRFYGDLLGWKVDADNPERYGGVDTGAAGGIPGGMYVPGEAVGEYVSFYAQVADVDSALADTLRLGGRVAAAAVAIPSGARIAMIYDPEGHRIGLIQQPVPSS